MEMDSLPFCCNHGECVVGCQPLSPPVDPQTIASENCCDAMAHYIRDMNPTL